MPALSPTVRGEIALRGVPLTGVLDCLQHLAGVALRRGILKNIFLVSDSSSVHAISFKIIIIMIMAWLVAMNTPMMCKMTLLTMHDNISNNYVDVVIKDFMYTSCR